MIDISQSKILSSKVFDQHKEDISFQQKLQLATYLSQDKVNTKFAWLDINITCSKTCTKVDSM